MRATGIFTGTTSSPCQLARQSHFRYAIRAGRNLPDKEFRSSLLHPHSQIQLRDLESNLASVLIKSFTILIGKGTTLVVPPGLTHSAALAAEGMSPSEAEWTFLPLSACRHAVRTLSFPTQVRVGIWLVVSEDFNEDRLSLTFPADYLHPSRCHASRRCGTAEAVPFQSIAP